MKKLYQKVEIDNLYQIQRELIDLVDITHGMTKTHAFSVENHIIEKFCPIFVSWLAPRLKSPVRLFRFYVTEPWGQLLPHIDGSKELKYPFGLNIPVANCDNTWHIFYECDEDKIKNIEVDGYLLGCVPVDEACLIEKTRILLNEPHFVRNDVMHSVINFTDHYRIMLTVRWILDPVLGREFEDVFEFGHK